MGARGHRLAFERDRKRDQVLLAAGIRVLRITDRQLKHEPIAVAARIAQALPITTQSCYPATLPGRHGLLGRPVRIPGGDGRRRPR